MYSNLNDVTKGRRALAYIIDLAVVFVINAILEFILMVIGKNTNIFQNYSAGGGVTIAAIIITAFVVIMYFWIIPYLWKSQTIGRSSLRILVVQENYDSISFSKNVLREALFSIFSVIFWIVDLVFVLLKKDQLLQDKIAATRTVLLEDEKINQEQRVIREVSNQHMIAIVTKTVSYLFLFIIAITILFPFYWMINSSLKTKKEFFEGVNSVATFYPHEAVMWSNYPDSMHAASFTRYFFNTALVGVVSTILSIVITILGAYAFSRMKFKGKELLFSILLASMMIPGEMFTTTNYVTASKWQWTNSYAVLMVPFLVSVFYIYLLRQNFMQIPEDLYLAAKIDGTSDMRYLVKVMIPLAKPSIITITILKMMGAWNAYIWPHLINSEDSFQLITSGLREAFNRSVAGEIRPDTQLQMAACTIVSIPLFIIFLLFRKYIMRGVSRSGIKG